MANTGYIGNSNTATVGNILYWNRGYSTAAAGVCAECRSDIDTVRKPKCHCRREHHPGRSADIQSGSPSNRERQPAGSAGSNSVRELDRALRLGVKQQPRAIITTTYSYCHTPLFFYSSFRIAPAMEKGEWELALSRKNCIILPNYSSFRDHVTKTRKCYYVIMHRTSNK
jgi:hypothetical protein